MTASLSRKLRLALKAERGEHRGGWDPWRSECLGIVHAPAERIGRLAGRLFAEREARYDAQQIDVNRQRTWRYREAYLVDSLNERTDEVTMLRATLADLIEAVEFREGCAEECVVSAGCSGCTCGDKALRETLAMAKRVL